MLLRLAQCLADAHLADEGAQAAILCQVHLDEEVAPLLPGPVLQEAEGQTLSRRMHSSWLELLGGGDAAVRSGSQQAHLADDVGVGRQGGDCLNLMQAPARSTRAQAEQAASAPCMENPNARAAPSPSVQSAEPHLLLSARLLKRRMERLTAKSSPVTRCRARYTSLSGERPMTASKAKWSSKWNTLGVRRRCAAAVAAMSTCRP